MTSYLLLISMLLQTQQGQLEQQLQRQLIELQQIRQDLRREFEEIRAFQESRATREMDLKPLCTADLRWVSNGEDRKVAGTSAATVPLNLFSVVGRPTECLPAEIRVTASYLDTAGNLICGGAVENAALQTSPTQNVNFDVRPWNLREFVRWRNEPPQTNSGAKRLVCLNPEGVVEATDEEFARISTVRVRATVLPTNGGTATVEIKLNLR